MKRMIMLLMALILLCTVASAERIQEEVWVLCMPDSEVNVREKPKKTGQIFGGAMCGACMWTDNVKKNGYLHVLDLAAESDTGWISARYVVYDEPVEVNAVMEIRSDGRVACRRWINGKINSWIMNGDRLTVYWMSPSWAVTSRGYIRSEFLTEVMESDSELPGVR
jgi:hypothetical protein